MDNRTTIGDRPAGWRGSLTVSLPISVWEYTDLLRRLSHDALRLHVTTSRLFQQLQAEHGTSVSADDHQDRALLVAQEADGWAVTVVQQRR